MIVVNRSILKKINNITSAEYEVITNLCISEENIFLTNSNKVKRVEL